MDDPLQEVEFEISGKTYRVRPTFKLVTMIERATGVGCTALGMKVTRSEATMDEIAISLYVIARDQEPKTELTPERIGESLMEDGYAGVRDSLATLLLRSFRGNRELGKLNDPKDANGSRPTGNREATPGASPTG
jgi:hypothetical protein